MTIERERMNECSDWRGWNIDILVADKYKTLAIANCYSTLNWLYWKLSAILVQNRIECHYHKSRYSDWIEFEFNSSCPKIESMAHYLDFNIVLMIIKMNEIKAMKLWIWLCHWINSYFSFSYGTNSNRNDLIFNTSFWKYCHFFLKCKKRQPLQLRFHVFIRIEMNITLHILYIEVCEKKTWEKVFTLLREMKKILRSKLLTISKQIAYLLTCIAVVLIDVKTCFWPSFNEWPVSTEFSNLKLFFHFIWDGNNKKKLHIAEEKNANHCH